MTIRSIRHCGRTALALCLAAGALASIAPTAAQGAAGYRVHLGVAPNPDISGDPLTIFGTLANSNGQPVRGVRIELLHRVNPALSFTPIQHGRTLAGGQFQFDRAEGVVVSNREWYALALSPTGAVLARSNIVHEHVYAELTLNASASSVETGHPITFSGTVSPSHAGARVILERQVGTTGTVWHRIGSARIEGSGGYSMTRSFARPSESGALTIRAVLRGDARNIRSFSEAISVTVQQAQSADLTLSPSAPAIVAGESVTLSGKLLSAALGTVGGQQVTLYAHVHGGPMAPIAETTSNPEGAFSFSQTPLRNSAYEVRAAGRSSAVVYEGVHDVITATPSTTTGTVGQRITIEGQVSPAHEGHVVFLQLRNSAGRFQSLQAAYVGAGSHFSLSHQLQSAGSKTYRIYIPGGPENLGATSPTFTVNVNPASVVPALESTPSGEGQ